MNLVPLMPDEDKTFWWLNRVEFNDVTWKCPNRFPRNSTFYFRSFSPISLLSKKIEIFSVVEYFAFARFSVRSGIRVLQKEKTVLFYIVF